MTFLTLNYIYILNQLDELYVNILSKLRDFTLWPWHDLEMTFLTLNYIYILNQLVEFYKNISSKVPALKGTYYRIPIDIMLKKT